MFSTRTTTTTAVLAVPLSVLLATSGCGSKKTTASSAPSHTSAAAGTGTSSHSSGSGASKTCPAGDTRGVINGAVKCLTAGQQCSSKVISQYGQYGFVCRKQTNGYQLTRA